MKNKVYIENIKETREYESNILLSDILKDVEARLPYPVYLAKLDNAYRALTHLAGIPELTGTGIHQGCS